MVRQKVKGTGHKQPSDASSEPNFYAMPPIKPEPSFQESYPVAIASQQYNELSMSPNFETVQGAASVLQGIAAGYQYSGLPSAPFVGYGSRPMPFYDSGSQDNMDQGSYLRPNAFDQV